MKRSVCIALLWLVVTLTTACGAIAATSTLLDSPAFPRAHTPQRSNPPDGQLRGIKDDVPFSPGGFQVPTSQPGVTLEISDESYAAGTLLE